jgi:hypothetical protein
VHRFVDRLHGTRLLPLLGLVLALAIVTVRSRSASDPGSGSPAGPPFANVERAAWALVTALQNDDAEAMRRLLGDGVTLDRALLAEASRELVWFEDVDERCVKLRLGYVGLAAPIALVRDVAGWRFASTDTQSSCAAAPPR